MASPSWRTRVVRPPYGRERELDQLELDELRRLEAVAIRDELVRLTERIRRGDVHLEVRDGCWMIA